MKKGSTIGRFRSSHPTEWKPEIPKRTQPYQQLTEGQRYQMQALNSKGFSQREIAAEIKVHPSTVSRELKRNSVNRMSDCASTAQGLTTRRGYSASRKWIKLDERHFKIIADGLLMGWSPEKLSLRMKLAVPELALSHKTIYRRIAADKINGGQRYTKLCRFGKSRFKGGKRYSGRMLLPERIDISQRPPEVAKRSRIGDWEGDTVHGKSYLVTLAERKSRLVLINKVADKRAETVAVSMIQLLRRVDCVHTITLNNGGEFAYPRQIAKASGADIDFAKPYLAINEEPIKIPMALSAVIGQKALILTH